MALYIDNENVEYSDEGEEIEENDEGISDDERIAYLSIHGNDRIDPRNNTRTPIKVSKTFEEVMIGNSDNINASSNNRLTAEYDKLVGNNIDQQQRMPAPVVHADNHFLTSTGDVHITLNVKITSPGLSTKLSPDGKLVAVALQNGHVQIFHWGVANAIYDLCNNEIMEKNESATGMCWAPLLVQKRGLYLAVTYTSGGGTRIWHCNTGKAVIHLEIEGDSLGCAIDSTGRRVATVGSTGVVYVHEIAAHKTRSSDGVQDRLLLKLRPSFYLDKMDGHRERVFAAQFHPIRHEELYTAGWDGTVQVWNLADVEPPPVTPRKPSVPSRRSSVASAEDLDDEDQARIRGSVKHVYGAMVCSDSAMAVDAAHDHIITGSYRTSDQLQVWDAVSCELLKTLRLPPNFNARLYVAQWLGDNFLLIGGCTPNGVLVLRRSSMSVIASVTNFEKGVCSASAMQLSSHDRLADWPPSGHAKSTGVGAVTSNDAHITNIEFKIAALTEDQLAFIEVKTRKY